MRRTNPVRTMPCSVSRNSLTFSETTGLRSFTSQYLNRTLSAEGEQRLSRHHVDIDARFFVVVVLSREGLSVPDFWDLALLRGQLVKCFAGVFQTS